MKNIILLFAFLMLAGTGYSQDYNRNTTQTKPEKQETTQVKKEMQKEPEESRHEITAWVAGGLSSLQYSPTVGKFKDGYGGAFGVGYTYMFHPKWGISTGLELAIYNAKTTITDHSDNYPVIDDEDQYNQLTLMADIDNFEEKQQAYYLNIPLMLQYQGKAEEGNKFYAALGGKFGIPVSGKYKSTGDYLTKGKYQFTQDIFENMPEHGYGLYDDLKADKKLKFDINIQLSAEAGYKWKLDDKLYLYTGVYCDYGLNDIRKEKDSPYNLLQYNRENPIDYTINSIAESHYSNDKGTSNYMKKMNTLAFGLKLKIAFK